MLWLFPYPIVVLFCTAPNLRRLHSLYLSPEQSVVSTVWIFAVLLLWIEDNLRSL